MEKVALINDFHGTSSAVIPAGGILSASQVKRLKAKLCPFQDCKCSGLGGVRGGQHCLEDLFDGRAKVIERG